MTRFTQYSEGTRKGGFLSCFFKPPFTPAQVCHFFFKSKIVSHQTFNNKKILNKGKIANHSIIGIGMKCDDFRFIFDFCLIEKLKQRNCLSEHAFFL